MLIDLHTHTTKHSACSEMSTEMLIEAAIEIGLDGIVLTDHNCFWNQDEINELL